MGNQAPTAVGVGSSADKHVGMVGSVAFDPTGRLLASGAREEGIVKVWDLTPTKGASSEQPLPVLSKAFTHYPKVFGVSFSPEGLLGTVGGSQCVQLWRPAAGSATKEAPLVDTGLRPRANQYAHSDAVKGIHFAQHGNLVVTASADKTVKVWNRRHGGNPHVITSGMHDKPLHALVAVAVSPDGRFVAAAEDDRRHVVHVWSGPGWKPWACLKGHQKRVNSLAFDASSRLLATASSDRTCCVWDLSKPPKGPTETLKHPRHVYGCAFSRAGILGTTCDDGKLRLYTPQSGNHYKLATGVKLKDKPIAIAFSPAGDLVAVGGMNATVRVWRLAREMAPASTGVSTAAPAVTSSAVVAGAGGSGAGGAAPTKPGAGASTVAAAPPPPVPHSASGAAVVHRATLAVPTTVLRRVMSLEGAAVERIRIETGVRFIDPDVRAGRISISGDRPSLVRMAEARLRSLVGAVQASSSAVPPPVPSAVPPHNDAGPSGPRAPFVPAPPRSDTAVHASREVAAVMALHRQVLEAARASKHNLINCSRIRHRLAKCQMPLQEAERCITSEASIRPQVLPVLDSLYASLLQMNEAVRAYSQGGITPGGTDPKTVFDAADRQMATSLLNLNLALGYLPDGRLRSVLQSSAVMLDARPTPKPVAASGAPPRGSDTRGRATGRGRERRRGARKHETGAGRRRRHASKFTGEGEAETGSGAFDEDDIPVVEAGEALQSWAGDASGSGGGSGLPAGIDASSVHVLAGAGALSAAGAVGRHAEQIGRGIRYVADALPGASAVAAAAVEHGHTAIAAAGQHMAAAVNTSMDIPGAGAVVDAAHVVGRAIADAAPHVAEALIDVGAALPAIGAVFRLLGQVQQKAMASKENTANCGRIGRRLAALRQPLEDARLQLQRNGKVTARVLPAIDAVHTALLDVQEVVEAYASKGVLGRMVSSSRLQRQFRIADEGLAAAVGDLNLCLHFMTQSKLDDLLAKQAVVMEVKETLNRVLSRAAAAEEARRRYEERMERQFAELRKFIQSASSHWSSAGSSAAAAAMAEPAPAPSVDHDQAHMIPWSELQPLGAALGHGTFADVFEATWSGAAVAVKVLKTDGRDRKVIKALHHETHMLSRLPRHPSLLRFYGMVAQPESRRHPAVFGLVTELIQGQSLARVLEDASDSRGGNLSWTDRINYAASVAEGLAALHAVSPPVGPIVHADLKSGNVMVATRTNHVVLVDFGLSRVVTTTTTSRRGGGGDGDGGGSIRWSAPERFSGPPGRKSDVYSLGVVLWEIASCCTPFEFAGSNANVLALVASGKRPDVRRCHRDMPPVYAEVMQECWEQAPKYRPSAAAAARRLRRLEESLSKARRATTAGVAGDSPMPSAPPTLGRASSSMSRGLFRGSFRRRRAKSPTRGPSPARSDGSWSTSTGSSGSSGSDSDAAPSSAGARSVSSDPARRSRPGRVPDARGPSMHAGAGGAGAGSSNTIKRAPVDTRGRGRHAAAMSSGMHSSDHSATRPRRKRYF